MRLGEGVEAHDIDGSIVLHRVIRAGADGLIAKGDSTRALETIDASAIIGLLASISPLEGDGTFRTIGARGFPNHVSLVLSRALAKDGRRWKTPRFTKSIRMLSDAHMARLRCKLLAGPAV